MSHASFRDEQAVAAGPDVDDTTVDALTGLHVPAGIRLEHCQRTIGTEVHGLDLRDELGSETSMFLKKLWLERKVIFFRDQPLSEDQHVRFGQIFGELDVLPQVGDGASRPELLVIRRNGSDGSGNEAFFHQDVPYADPPCAGSVALLRECPPIGGDTIFADMAAAYDGLSPWLKTAANGLTAEHRFDEGIRYHNSAVSQELIDAYMRKYPPKAHPLVHTHSETGQRILYVSQTYTSRILDLPQDESAALIALLSSQARRPEYQCRFRWQKNSIAIWDNRAVQHYACFDYPGEFRELHRVTILDERPWPDAAAR